MKKYFLERIASSRKFLYYLGLGLGLSLFLWQLWQGVQAIHQPAFQLRRPIYLLATLGSLLMAYALQMIAWAEIMRGLGSSLNMLTVFEGYIVSSLPRYIPGVVWGYLSRNEWLRSQHNISYATSTLGSTLEAGLIVLTASVVSISFYLWKFGPESLQWTIIPDILVVAWFSWYSLKWIWGLFVSRQSSTFAYQFRLEISFRRWLNAYLIYLAMWSCYGLSLFSLLNVFSAEYNGNFIEPIALFTLSWLAGFLVIIVPSGLGIREFALVNLLASLSILDVQTAIIVAVTARFTIYLTEVIWLSIGFLITRMRANHGLVERNSS